MGEFSAVRASLRDRDAVSAFADARALLLDLALPVAFLTVLLGVLAMSTVSP
jgi:hypothetical protein